MKSESPKTLLGYALVALCALSLTCLPLAAQDDPTTETNATPTVETSTPPATAEAATSDSDATTSDESGPRNRIRREAVVVFGGDATLKEGETTEAFVVIGGDGYVKGKVDDSAVVIGGNLYVDGYIRDEAVAVLGSVRLGSNAVVKGDIVSVGGHTDAADGASIGGRVQDVDVGAMGLPTQIGWLQDWFVHCALKLRPLSPKVGWVWVVAAAFALIYFAIAIVLRKPVDACLAEVTRRPVTTFFMGILTKMLAPIVTIILLCTVVGMIVVPFISAALLFGGMIGKVALLEYVGDSVRRAFGVKEPLKPVLALLIGLALLTVTYNIPILGLITYTISGLWGLGIAATAAASGMKREKRTPNGGIPAPVIPPVYPSMPITPAPQNFSAIPPNLSSTFGVTPEAASTAGGAAALGATMSVPSTATGVPEALAYPRAGFWERMGAAFLDIVIVSIITVMVEDFFHRLFAPPMIMLLVSLAYFAGMWTWKGMTIGGVVLNLKVARIDGRPLTFPVALIRALGGVLSLIVLFLGFLWIAWDPDKQAWHDRIAGTFVVRMPRGSSLVLL